MPLLGNLWVQYFFFWVFCGSKIFSCGYFLGLNPNLVGSTKFCTNVSKILLQNARAQQSARVTASPVSELLRENQYGDGGGGEITHPLRLGFSFVPSVFGGSKIFSRVYFLEDTFLASGASRTVNIDEKDSPVDTGRKLNVHKTFRRRPGRLLNVLCTFNLRPESTGSIYVRRSVYLFILPTNTITTCKYY